MLVSLALLLACYWVLGRLLRGALVVVMAGWVQRGRPPVPLAFRLRPVPVPAGEELYFAARASLWGPPAPPPPGRTWTLTLGRRRAYALDTGVWPPRVRAAVAGHERRAGGTLVVTSRRVLFRGSAKGAAARDDVPLADVAHLRVEGPLLTVERRSQPGRPLVVRVGTPAPVAKLVAAAAQAAAARAAAAPARRPGPAAPAPTPGARRP
jgi:hypothetical protein